MKLVSTLQIYVTVYVMLLALQPPGMFYPNGCSREFGIQPEQTLLPAWLFALLVALRLS